MNKGDLINKIAEGAKITKAQATDALNAVLDSIAAELKGDGKVTLIGFGTFSVSNVTLALAATHKLVKPSQLMPKKW